MSRTANELNHREHATLRAVADGRVEMSSGREPDLFVDGACCCNQVTAHHLAHEECSNRAVPRRAEPACKPY